MSQKNYLLVLKIGIYASFLVFLFVFSNLFFPFITSKQISFNLLIELLTIIWIFFIIRYPAYKPKKSLITKGLVAYFLVLLVSAILGQDFNLSFWGNAERMLGIFHILHFFLFYLIIVSVFREEKDWRHLFSSVLGVSVLVVLFIFNVKTPSSTIGNSAYAAALMIFALAFSAYLFQSTKSRLAKIFFSLGALICLYGFYRNDISGAQVGLVAGILAGMIVYGFLTPHKKLGRVSWISALVLIFLGIGLFSFRSAPVFDNNKLGHMLRAFSSDNVTWNTRLISWEGALKDFKNHPVLGVGFGNYAHIFDKEFNPRFFDLTPGETYFDRAHNNLIDIASTSGILGLLAYLSIFVATLIYLVQAYKKKNISPFELSLWLALLVAYFVQNLAVFDSLVTYVCLFLLLARIDYVRRAEEDLNLNLQPKKEYFTLKIVLLLVFFFSAWNFNIQGFYMFSDVIKGYRAMAMKDLDSAFIHYSRAVERPAPYKRDSRGNFLISSYQNPELFSDLPSKEKEEKFALLLSLAEKNIAYAKDYDSAMELQFAHTARLAARQSYQDLDKFNEYSAIAMVAINNAIEASPRRIPLYILKADLHFSRGEEAELLEVLAQAKSLKEDYYPVDCLKAGYLYYFGQEKEAVDLAIVCGQYNLASYIADINLAYLASEEAFQRGEEEAGNNLAVRFKELNK